MARKDEYKATEYPGIKQRIKDGKYLVVIDLGRQPRLDKKTGLMVQKQCKTQKVFDTLKEAKAYQGENNKAKSRQKVSKVAGKVTFRQAIVSSGEVCPKEAVACYVSRAGSVGWSIGDCSNLRLRW